MLVPAVSIDQGTGQFHKAHPSLHHPSRQHAFGGVNPCGFVPVVEAILFFQPIRFVGQLHEVGHFGLHAEGQFPILDGRIDLGIVHLGRMQGIQCPQCIQFSALVVGSLTRLDVGQTVASRHHALGLVFGGEEAAAKAIESPGRGEAAIEHHKGRQVFVFISQAIAHPRSHGRASRQTMTGVQKVVGVGVLGEGTGHGTHHAQLVGLGGQVGKERTDGVATLSVLLERPRTWKHAAHVFKLCRAAFPREGLARPLLQFRLGIKSIHLPRAAIHVQENHTAGFGGVVFESEAIRTSDPLDASREGVL